MEGVQKVIFDLIKKLNLSGTKELIYVAGKIRNEENYRKQFETAKNYLSDNYDVITAAELVDYIEDLNGGEAKEYQIWAAIFEVIEHCEMVYFLDNWTTSPGAKLEFEIARYYEKQIEFETSETIIHPENFTGLVEYIGNKFGYHDKWFLGRREDFALTKKCVTWVMKNDFQLTYKEINRRLGVQFNHASFHHHIQEVENYIVTSQTKNNYYKDEITHLNLLRNLIHAYIKDNNE
jgi:hypothetical protein